MFKNRILFFVASFTLLVSLSGVALGSSGTSKTALEAALNQKGVVIDTVSESVGVFKNDRLDMLRVSAIIVHSPGATPVKGLSVWIKVKNDSREIYVDFEEIPTLSAAVERLIEYALVPATKTEQVFTYETKGNLEIGMLYFKYDVDYLEDYLWITVGVKGIICYTLNLSQLKEFQGYIDNGLEYLKTH